MSQEIIKVLEYLGDKLGIAIDWTAENVIPYAEELFKRYVTLKITYASVGTLIGIVLATTAIVLAIKMTKGYIETSEKKISNMWWRYSNYWNEARTTDFFILGLTATVICGMFAIPVLGCNISSLIQWIIVPEIPFVKEIASLFGTTI